jgi:signal transduction histidine kinase/CheY-like chemotaxis protein
VKKPLFLIQTQNTTIKKKLIRITLLTMSVTFVAVSGALLAFDRITFRDAMANDLSIMVETIAWNTTSALSFGDPDAADNILAALKANSNILYGCIYGQDNKIFAQYSQGEGANCPPEPLDIGQHFMPDSIAIVEPILLDDEQVGTIYILSNLENLYSHMILFAKTILLLFIIYLVIIGMLISKLFDRYLTKPLELVVERIKKIALGNLKQDKLQIHSQDELGVLADNLNKMLFEWREFISCAEEIFRGNIKTKLFNVEGDFQESLKNMLNQSEEKAKIETNLKYAKEEADEARIVAEKASMAKSDFLARISHELRTPMNAILGFSQLMEIDIEEPPTPSQIDHLHEISKAGNHLLELINEVLDLARIESGKLKLSLESIGLKDIFEETISLILPLADQKNVQVIFPSSSFSKLFVIADRSRLKQVILNLLSNAVKYNRDGGSITLDTEKTKKNKVIIHFTDTGRGIPKENLNSLFEPFNRLDADTTEIEGTGIGLSITKHLMELMGGHIFLKSTFGEGSRFSIEFSEGENRTLSEEDEQLIPPALNTLRTGDDKKRFLLYVEDNPTNLSLVQKIFSKFKNIHLFTAPEARLGIDIAESHQLDLILMDINLPGMDGVTALEHLKKNKTTSQIPVIAVSANAMESDIAHAMNAGFDSYVTKPIKISDFLGIINNYLELN